MERDLLKEAAVFFESELNTMSEPMSDAQKVIDAITQCMQSQKRTIVAVSGAPASGKSTFAEDVLQAFANQCIHARLVAMDGFHLDNCILEQMQLRDRKGAAETFDVYGFIQSYADFWCMEEKGSCGVIC